jgi:hypothetical protein
MCLKRTLEYVQVHHCAFFHSLLKGPFESVITTTKTLSRWIVWCAETCWRFANVWRMHLVHAKLVLLTKYRTYVWGHPCSNAGRNTGYSQKDFSGLSSSTPSRTVLSSLHHSLISRCRRPRGLRRRSAAASLLGMQIRIPSGVLMLASYECCVVTSRGLCDGPIPRPGYSYQACVCVCVYHWVWLSAMITIYTQNEQADRGLN